MCSRGLNKWGLIPDHILQVIFSKLPIVKLPTCRLVCKTWNHLVVDSKFVPNTYFVFKLYNESIPFLGVQLKNIWSDYLKMHCIEFDGKYSQGMNVVASFRFDYRFFGLRISNCCNGLLCIIDGLDFRRTCVGILNPMTNEYIRLPFFKDYDKFYLYGFGFSLKTKQYKVARVSYDQETKGCCIIEIFTLGKGSSSKWSHVQSLSFVIENDGVYFHGALYWIGEDKQGKKVICCLSVEDEKFEIISLPKQAYNNVAIGVFNDNLYTTFWAGGDYKFEVWTMEISYGEAKISWMKEFVVDDIPNDWRLGVSGIPWREHLQLIKACENGQILCLLDKFYLFFYNPTTRNIKPLIEDKSDETTFWIYQIQSLNFHSLHSILVAA